MAINNEVERARFIHSCGDRFGPAFAKGYRENGNRFADANLNRLWRGWLQYAHYNDLQRREARKAREGAAAEGARLFKAGVAESQLYSNTSEQNLSKLDEVIAGWREAERLTKA